MRIIAAPKPQPIEESKEKSKESKKDEIESVIKAVINMTERRLTIANKQHQQSIESLASTLAKSLSKDNTATVKTKNGKHYKFSIQRTKDGKMSGGEIWEFQDNE